MAATQTKASINGKNKKMKKFEYKTLVFEPGGKWVKVIQMETQELENQLNELGSNGWELINSSDYASEGYTQKVILYFKREIANSDS